MRRARWAPLPWCLCDSAAIGRALPSIPAQKMDCRSRQWGQVLDRPFHISRVELTNTIFRLHSARAHWSGGQAMPQCTQLLVRRGPHEAESAAHQSCASCGSIGLEGAETSATGIPDAGTQDHAWLPLSEAGQAVRLPYCVTDAMR